MAELDPAALHRATKLLPPQVGADPDYRRVIAEGVITSYLAVLPEPPLDEWLKFNAFHIALKALDGKEDRSTAAKAGLVADALLEALAEHRKESDGG